LLRKAVPYGEFGHFCFGVSIDIFNLDFGILRTAIITSALKFNINPF